MEGGASSLRALTLAYRSCGSYTGLPYPFGPPCVEVRVELNLLPRLGVKDATALCYECHQEATNQFDGETERLQRVSAVNVCQPAMKPGNLDRTGPVAFYRGIGMSNRDRDR